MIHVGTGQADITPPLGAAMAGYFEPHFAKEIVNPLLARAVVFDDGSTRVAIVACDVLAISRISVDRIRSMVDSRLGMPPGNVLVCATHTHTGPLTTAIFGQKPDEGYLHHLEVRVVDAVAQAVQRLDRCTLAFGYSEEPRLNCNRRLVFADGSVHTHTTEGDLPEVVHREGPADAELAALVAENGSATVKALLVNYALHPTNVRGDRICTDFPGYLADALERHFNAPGAAVYLNGACGNLDSKTLFLAETAYGPERAQRIGEILSLATARAVECRTRVEGSPIKSLRKHVSLPLRPVQSEDVTRAQSVMREEAPTTLHFTRGTRRPTPLKERIYAEEYVSHAERLQHETHVEGEIQLICLGELAIVSAPVELFTEFGLAIKAYAERRFKRVMIAELANGYWGYVPTRRSFEGGGYETRLASSSCLAPEAGDMIVSAAKELMARA